MSMLPPKLRDLDEWLGNGKPRTNDIPRKVWEISVPTKKSLLWSLGLSTLLLESDEDLASLLRKLIGSEKEQVEIKQKKKLTSEITTEDVENFFSEFNPFETRHNSYQSPKMSEIVRIFELRLNRYANKVKTAKDVWNDDLKLRAAAQLLQTTIEVYFPDDIEVGRFKSYSETASNPETKIVLFQYENKGHKARIDAINVFHFAMSQKHANRLTLETPERCSKKTEVEDFGRTEKHTLLLPPRLRNLNDWIKNGNSRTSINPREFWEISTPAKTSLYWSIVLSVLLLDSDEDLTFLLRKLIGSEEEEREIRKRKKLMESEVTPEDVENFFSKFNPFKNRHASLIQSPKISEIVRIFNLRLNRYANEMKTKEDIWNDDLKLRAAAKLLKTPIDVYFPDDIEAGKFKTYAGTKSNNKTKIILFQYENKEHKSREDAINVFYFAMSKTYAHHRKLDALKHFLVKAKVENFRRQKVQSLMIDSQAHGPAFLPTIIKNNCVDVLPEIYESPYIAFKLSEAGFETNPVLGIKDNLSAFYYASGKCDPKYLRILYDYASNCRHLFDRSARRADDDVLENLRLIKSIIEKDINEVQRNSENTSIEVCVLKQIKKFVSYQTEVANNVKQLISCQFSSDKFQYRKSIIISILEYYLNYFYYEFFESGNLSFLFKSYCSFPEYYEYVDHFSFLFFFDNFFKLRICCGLKDEDVVLNTEWSMFLVMMSNKCFPHAFGEYASVDQFKAEDCGGNILRYIPLFYRNAMEKEIRRFSDMIEYSSDSKSLEEEKVAKDSVSMSQIVDELIVQRLNKYFDAVLEISPRSDKMKAVLVVERALQVLGESIKPPSSKTSIVSFLLRSCFEPTFQFNLTKIRNDLSKYRSNSVYGRTEIEKDYTFFEGMKEEFKTIQNVFQSVNFTQYFRIEESLINQALVGLEKEIDFTVYEKLKKTYEIFENQKVKAYEKYYDTFIKLLHDSFTDLHENSKKSLNKHQQIFGQLKSIEYLITYIQKIKYVRYLNDLVSDIRRFVEETEDSENLELETKGDEPNQIQNQISKTLDPLLIKCINSIENNHTIQQVKVSAPCISQFFNRLKTSMFSDKEIREIYEAVNKAMTEAKEAMEEVKSIFYNKLYESIENINDLLKKVLLPFDKLPEIKRCFENREEKLALKFIEKPVSENSIQNDLKNMLEKDSAASGYAYVLITKLAFQRYLSSKFYTSVSLPEEICAKLEFLVTKKVNFLLTRLVSLKDILIDEDEEIRSTNEWGKSEPIKYHLKFLMRQRYQREKAICASLEMAYFDCMNIFCQQSKDDDDLSSDQDLRFFYEKSKDLYTGINLRNIVSHRQNIPVTIGDILDESDFPSEMIDKMCELIDDTEAIKAIFDVFRLAGVFREEDFVNAIENDGFREHERSVRVIKECPRWKNYLFLFPFIRT